MRQVVVKGKEKKEKSSKEKVLVSILLDESGSMNATIGKTFEGFNSYIDGLKQETNQNIVICLNTFNSILTEAPIVRSLWENISIKDCGILSSKNYHPDGYTPLYDAIAETVEKVDRFSSDVSRVLFVIITDGQENDSRKNKKNDIVRMIQEREGKGWTFIYIGANQDAWQEGENIGVRGVNTMTYNQGQENMMYNSLRVGTQCYLSAPKTSAQYFFVDRTNSKDENK